MATSVALGPWDLGLPLFFPPAPSSQGLTPPASPYLLICAGDKLRPSFLETINMGRILTVRQSAHGTWEGRIFIVGGSGKLWERWI